MARGFCIGKASFLTTVRKKVVKQSVCFLKYDIMEQKRDDGEVS